MARLPVYSRCGEPVEPRDYDTYRTAEAVRRRWFAHAISGPIGTRKHGGLVPQDGGWWD